MTQDQKQATVRALYLAYNFLAQNWEYSHVNQDEYEREAELIAHTIYQLENDLI